MARKLLEIVEGWTDEIGPFTLKADDQAIDLTGMTVALIMRDHDGLIVEYAGQYRIDDDRATGKVYFKPAASDFVHAKGPYRVRWQVTDGIGDIVFFPNGAHDEIVVFKR